MTTETIVYRDGSAAAADIEAHLRACDARYRPPLSSRVDIAAYAAKLADNATTFEAWRGATLIGLVAAYLNDTAGRSGFISSVSVDASAVGTGIASRLLYICLEAARGLDMERIDLHVSCASHEAIALYRKLGFIESGGDTGTTTMRLTLAEPTQ